VSSRRQPADAPARRIRRPGSGHDRHPRLVVCGGTGSLEAGLAGPEVVAAQQQLDRRLAAGGITTVTAGLAGQQHARAATFSGAARFCPVMSCPEAAAVR
jgi:hypothetical protein